MRRYVVEVHATVRIKDEANHTVASLSAERSVAVDIRGSERDLIVKQVGDEMSADMVSYVQTALQSVREQQTQ